MVALCILLAIVALLLGGLYFLVYLPLRDLYD
jgi:hypothetical protein